MLSRISPCIGCAWVVCLAGSFAAADEPSKAASADEAFPIVIRIDRAAITKAIDSERDEVRPIDKTVMGTRAVGASRTRGKSYSKLIENPKQAAFEIHFEGQTETKTVGYNGPVVIHSRTYTDFDCTQRVVFDPRRGFYADGDVEVRGDTRLIYDGFTSKNRVGRRLIETVAARKAEELHEQARQLADRDNKHDVSVGFRQILDQRIAAANRETAVVQHVNRILGENGELQLYSVSCADCVQIGIGQAGQTFTRLPELPRKASAGQPVECWVHYSALGGPVLALLNLTSSDDVPLEVREKLSNVMSLTDRNRDMQWHDGWLVVGLADLATTPFTASAPQGTTIR